MAGSASAGPVVNSMVEKKGESDWTAERVNRFWQYYASRPDLRGTYFSLQMGAGMTRFLDQAGVLRGDVLDYGCGLGFLCEAMLARRVECWGCDGSPDAVQASDRLLRGKRGWHGASLSSDPRAPFRDRRFDLVTCIETVEHLPPEGKTRVLSDIGSLLRPGGSLFITTPNDEELGRAMHYCPFCDAEFHSMQHLSSFDRGALRLLLEGAGFEVIYSDAVDFAEIQAPVVPSLLDLSARSLLRSARRLAFESYDRLSGRRFPSRFEHPKAGQKFPHLVALAVKRG